MIDLPGLIAEFTVLGERFIEWNTPIVEVDRESWRKVHNTNAIAPYCDDKPTPGGCISVRDKLANFHIYAYGL